MDRIATREAFGNALVKLADSYPDFVVLDADLSAATKTTDFARKYAKRAFNLGIAEQNMMGFAAGLSTIGFIPFACTFAVFAAGRAFDQIRQSIAYPRANVKIAATHAGLTVGEDGATHQAVEDIALMRALPNMTVVIPSDAVETEKAVEAAIRYRGPVYLRLGREQLPVIMQDDYQFEIGKAVMLKEGKDVTFIVNGLLVAYALRAVEILQNKGIDAGVLNVHTVKPLDDETILKTVEKTPGLITAEEHSVIGGLGGAVDEMLIREGLNKRVKVINIGIEDKFGQTGTAEQLLKAYDLTVERLVDEAVILTQGS